MDDKELVGNLLKEYRAIKGYKQKELAKALDIRLSTYSNYESGYRLLPVKYITRLSELLDVPIEKFANVHPHINNKFGMLSNTDYSKEVAEDFLRDMRFNEAAPLIKFMIAEGYNIDLLSNKEISITIKNGKEKLNLSETDYKKINESVLNYINYELYKKLN